MSHQASSTPFSSLFSLHFILFTLSPLTDIGQSTLSCLLLWYETSKGRRKEMGDHVVREFSDVLGASEPKTSSDLQLNYNDS